MTEPQTTRDRIVKAASSLFYREGIRAVGVDAVAAKAGVTKRTLYYHFRSKDDLVAAYLERRDQPNLRALARWFEEAPGDAAARVGNIFAELAKAARSHQWRGCGFLRTAAELAAMPGHPAVKTAERHKQRFEAWLSQALAREGVSGPERLAREIRLLMDGAFAVVLLNRDPSYFETAGAAAQRLVRSAPAGVA